MTKEEKIKDLEFLKEMKSNIDEMVNGYNLVKIQHVQTMIEDWIDELEKTKPNNTKIKIDKYYKKYVEFHNRVMDGADPDELNREIFKGY